MTGRCNSYSARALARLLLATLLVCIPVLAPAQSIPPTVAQITFAPATIQSGASSQLVIAFGNANEATATLTQALTNTFPAGMTVANPAAAGGSCPGALIASAGAHSVAYPNGASIPPGGCTLQVRVTATSTTRNTYYTDSIPAGALQTNLGSNPATASGTLTVQSAAVVPNVVGMTQNAAATALQAAGFSLGTVTKGPGPATIPFNSVFSQVPAAGAVAATGTAVAVHVSTGAGLATNSNRPLTSVPNFVAPYQLSEAAALERVCAALGGIDPSTLSVPQRNLFANCTAIIGTHGGGVDAAGLAQTLSAISGMQSTAQQRVGVQFAGAQFTNIGTRLMQLRQDLRGSSFSGLDLGVPGGNGLGQLFAALEDATGRRSDSGSPAGTDSRSSSGGGAGDATLGSSSRLGFFINGSVRRGSQDPTTYETPFDFRSTSITAGVDYRMTDRWIIGGALGHSSGTTEFTDGTGRLDSHSNLISLYGTYYQDALYVDLIGTYGHISYDATRTTTFTINLNTPDVPRNCTEGQCSVDTNGSTSAQQLAFSGNVGYSFNSGGFTLGPDMALNYTHIKVNAFSENDPNQSGMALVFGEDVGESLLGKIGGHIAYAIKTSFAVILPEARAHYVYEFKNDQSALPVHFGSDPYAGSQSGPVSNFVVFTDTPDRSYYDWAAGFSAQFAYGISAFADYHAIASSDQRVHEFAFGLRIEHQVP